MPCFLKKLAHTFMAIERTGGKDKSEVVPGLAVAEGGRTDVQQAAWFLPPGELTRTEKEQPRRGQRGPTLSFPFYYVVIGP